MPKPLREREIEDLLTSLEAGEISEDNWEDEDEDEGNFYLNAREIFEDLVEESILDIAPNEETARESPENPPHTENIPCPSNQNPPHIENIPGTSDQFNFDKRSLIWKMDNLLYDENKISHPPGVTDTDILDLDTPYRCFLHYFTPEFIQIIADETNLFATQKNPSNNFSVTTGEIKKFFGILIFMSVQNFPSVRSYWQEKFGYEPIRNVMSVNRFETIRSYLHFKDNSKHVPKEHPDHDRLHKIRPVIEHLNKRFCTVAMDQRLSIDEQICSTKIAHFLKQYLPKKPHKWGYKLFVLCSLKGYAYRFEVYSGQENDKEKPTDEPDLGITNNVVLRLARVVPRMVNHIVFFDNFYTSLPLVYFLAKQGIQCVGTVQQNRLPNCRLPDKNVLMKASVPRGTHEERVAHYDGIDFSATVWKDNKIVNLLSSYVGSQPLGKVSRFDKKLKQRVEIPCPKIVQEYNMHMGGVDLMDSYLGRYHVRVKSRKWYLRLFYHFLDLAVINAWLLLKNNSIAKGIPEKELPNLGQFRIQLADSLCNIGPISGNKRGRPSTSLERELEYKKTKKGAAHPLPTKDVRLDRTDHWPVFDKRLRCKTPLCKGTTQWACSKCKVPLCLNAKNNCFTVFHNS